MKVLQIKIGERTFTTGKITAFMSKETIKVNKEALELAKMGKQIQSSGNEDLDLVEDLLSKLEELNSKKAWIICKLYNDQFTVDDLENNLSMEEIDAQINQIIYGISGVVSKN